MLHCENLHLQNYFNLLQKLFIMGTTNKEKTPPKNDIKFTITLSDEQKSAKAKIIETPFNFILGKAGSGKTLLAVQIALDMFFKRQINKIIISHTNIICIICIVYTSIRFLTCFI